MSKTEFTTTHPINGKKVLVTGPSKSGKSRWAEHLISHHDSITYIATGAKDITDKEWQEKIRLHKLRRPEHWNLIETSNDLSACVNKLTTNIIIDSLGGFVSSHLEKTHGEWQKVAKEFRRNLATYKFSVVIVIEQTGWSVVPPTQLGILFSDRLGELSQSLELISDESWLVLNNRAINLTNISKRIP